MYDIKEASKYLGVSIGTLRRREDENKIISFRTTGNHRRYEKSELDKLKYSISPISNIDDKLSICYARVSTKEQKDDLTRQISVLEHYCSSRNYKYEIIQDFGSGLNYEKKGLKLLINKICKNEINRLIITNKDRLLRFGSELIFSLCEIHNVEIIILNSKTDSSFEESLVEDVLEIITVFTSRLYGSRSHKNKKIIEEIENVISNNT